MITTLFPIALCLMIQSAALLTLGLIAMRVARRRGPAVQSLIGRATLAGLGLALLLAGPLAGRVRGVWHVAVAQREPTPRQVAAPPETGGGGGRVIVKFSPLDGAAADGAAFPPAPSAETPLAARPTLPAALTPSPPVSGGAATCRGVGSLWAAGTALLLLWLIVCQWHLTRLRRQARPIAAGPAADTLAALAPRPPALLTHPSARSPFLAGVRHPAIFLPTTYKADFDPAALRAILAHELAHLERRDNAWTLAARLLSALLWPQPLLWALCRRLEQTGEEACDLAVLAQDCPPRAYAACLLTLAERHPLGHRERALGAGVAPFRSSLGQRIGRILNQGNHAMSTITTRLRLAVAALAAAAALGGSFLVSSAPAQSPGQATVTPTPGQQRFNAMRGQDKANLTAIGGALTQYAQDHDEHFPNAAHWMEALSPYLKDETVFFDPFQPGVRHYGYAFNRNCSRKSLASIGYPSEVVFVFDSTLGTRNANDTGQSLRYSDGTRRHTDLLLVDGRVKSTNTDAPPLFTIQPWRPPAHRPRHKAGQPQPPTALARAHFQQFRALTAALTAPHSDPELSNARFLARLTPVQGPGVVVTLNDSKKTFPRPLPPGMALPNIIHDSDINAVVNELRAAGAEAIAVNGQRLVAISPVRTAGATILINFTPTVPPYVIKAIGGPKTLASAMTMPGGIATQIKAYDPAMFSVKQASALTLPAYSGGGTPRYAKPVLHAAPRSTGDSKTMQGTGTDSPVTPIPGKAQRIVGYGLKMVFAGRPYCAAVKGSEAAQVGIPSNTFDEVIAVNDQAASPSGPHTLALLQTPPPLHLLLRGRDNQARSFTLSSRALLSVPPLIAVSQWEIKDLAVKRAGLASARRELLGAKQETEKEVRAMLPLADSTTLAAAIGVEQRYGAAVDGLKFARECEDLCRKTKDAEGYARAVQRQSEAKEQMKQSLSEEAKLFPATSPARDHLAQAHALAVRLADTQGEVNVKEGIVSLTLSVMQQQTGPTL